MADEQTITEQTNTSLANAIWGEVPAIQQSNTDTLPPPANTDTTPLASTDTPPPVDDKEEILEPNTYLKNKWGWESEEAADAEIKSLREKAAKVPEEIIWNDDQSKQIHELLREGKPENKKAVREYLQTQEQIDDIVLISPDQINKDNAENIIKLQIKLANKILSAKEVEFEYKQNFTAPKEPVQKITEDDDDFKERHDEWQEQVNIVEMRRIVAAKKAQPELAKLKTELVLPEINKGETGKKYATPEELEAFKKTQDAFLLSAKQIIDGFNGFTAQVKDKDVDYTVRYTPSVEEKALVSDKLTKLAESGFDANEIFGERWYDVNTRSFKLDQMTEDLSRIFMGKNSDQKLSVDAANKRLEAYLKEKKNVNVTEANRNSTFQPNGTQTQSEKLAENFFGKN